jgi:hypothetical protein
VGAPSAEGGRRRAERKAAKNATPLSFMDEIVSRTGRTGQ